MPTRVIEWRGHDEEGNVRTGEVSVNVTVPTTPVIRTALGSNIGQSNVGNVKWSQVARAYRRGTASTLRNSHKTRILAYSDPGLGKSTAAVKAVLQSLHAEAVAAGISNPETHFATQNEADRPGKPSTDNPPQFAIESRDARAAVDQVQGASLWVNLTRDNVLDGSADALKASFQYFHGAAVNMYDPNMERVTELGPKPFAQYIEPTMQWLKANGFKRVATWEMGAKIAPAKFDRAQWAKDYVDYWIASATRNGLEPVAICWWDPIDNYDFSNGRDSRWIPPAESPAGATLNAWVAKAAQLATT